MKLQDIHIRDPYVLLDEGTYYLYGTRAWDGSCWGEGTGFDVYTSTDLETWTEPVEVFRKPENFWASKNFWAPEVYRYRGAYYMFATFTGTEGESRLRGTQILKADSPMGPFLPHSKEMVTPRAWSCLDGTFYIEDGTPYLVFCHEWGQVFDGEICAVELSDDLTCAVGEPRLLFRASEPVWSDGCDCSGTPGYITDGPFLHRVADGRLCMIWSSFCRREYCQAVAWSDNGRLDGNWYHDEQLLIEKDGGHGMIFRTREGALKLVIHQPNNPPEERPRLFDLKEESGLSL